MPFRQSQQAAHFKDIPTWRGCLFWHQQVTEALKCVCKQLGPAGLAGENSTRGLHIDNVNCNLS